MRSKIKKINYYNYNIIIIIKLGEVVKKQTDILKFDYLLYFIYQVVFYLMYIKEKAI